MRRVKFEQEAKRSLEGDLSKSLALRKNLEARVKKEHLDKVSADLSVRELQSKLRQFEQEMTTVMAPELRATGAVSEFPAGLESQLDQLRRQLEDTVRAVRRRRTGADAVGEALEMKAIGQPHAASDASMGQAMPSPDSRLSLLETVSPCSSLDIALAVASSSADEFDMMGEELPAEEQLIGEWSTICSTMSLQEEGDQAPDELQRTGSVGSLGGLSAGSEPATPAAAAAAATPLSAATPRSAVSPTCHIVTCMEDAHCTVEAVRRTNALSLRDLSEIKALKKPPPPIRMLMEVCCLLFHIRPIKNIDEKNPKRSSFDYWEPARRYLLSDPFFPSKLRMYESEQVSHSQRVKIRRYFADPEFSADRVRNCSKAAHELYGWVRALVEERVPPTPTSPLVPSVAEPQGLAPAAPLPAQEGAAPR